ncbi:MAG TPA: glycosyltransferase family 39 protein [Bryobacteraceae bacterium]|nr:glycosyltransferase family 39 protein [Bryobacteraceae bacterium]
MKILVLIAALAMGLYGIERSLWLDETWVANSVLQPTLSGMFNYPDWLQTTPPLFLLLDRAVIHVFGLSNLSLRIIPLALSLVAVAALMAAASRVVSPAFAVLGGALMGFHPTVIEYSHTLKQYSGEMAAAAIILLLTILYLQDPSRRRFYWLVAAFALLLPLAYAVAFLLPGVAIAIGAPRASLLLAASGAVLAILYVFFIRPNTSPLLRAFWVHSAQGLTRGLLIALLSCIAAMLFMRSRVVLIALLPCLLLAVTTALHWYPNSPRTRLFVLPGFFLVAMIVAEKLIGKRRIVLVVAIGFVAVTAWKQVRAHRNRPEEDYAGAVQYLRDHAAPSDLIVVHASVKEGFKLYTHMDNWDRPVIYGDTGYPCCRRTVSTNSPVDELAGKIPNGRIWLFYSTRASHWEYVGRDESQLWLTYLQSHGCAQGSITNVPNLAIAAMDCHRS